MSRTRAANPPIETMQPPPSPVVQHATVDKAKAAMARQFRRRPTPAEAMAWQLLRNRNLLGLKFRRQQVIAGFVVDFYCAELRLALEFDGAVHHELARAGYDAERDKILSARGIDVLRLPNALADERSLHEVLTAYLQREAPLSRRERGVGG
jgi:very-short-patch-repair endonuclease